MAKASSGTGTGAGPKSGGKTKTAKSAPRKTRARAKAGGGSSGSKPKSGEGAADALVKLLESPLVAEVLAIGASAALASLAAGRFGRSEEKRGTAKALKTAAKSAAAAMGQRLATEVEEIRRASRKARDGETT